MELRQLRYFIRIVKFGSMSRAALDLDMVQSALSQQMSRLESELSTRLLLRDARGVTPTEAGVAFFREAQLTVRHADQAIRAAQEARLSGTVSVGLAPTTAATLGLPLMKAMRERYPDVRLHLVESMSGHLTSMLNARELDLAVLFDSRLHLDHDQASRGRWQVQSLIEEELFWIRSKAYEAPSIGQTQGATVNLNSLEHEALVLPTGHHGLRSTLDAAFARANFMPNVVMEVDSLSMVMSAVDAGIGSTIQPWAAMKTLPDSKERFQCARIDDEQARRLNFLCCLSEDELSPAALAARVVLRDCVNSLVKGGQWIGAHLTHHKSR